MQIPVGWALDHIGPRRTAAVLLGLGAGGGAVLFALATSPGTYLGVDGADGHRLFAGADGELLHHRARASRRACSARSRAR